MVLPETDAPELAPIEMDARQIGLRVVLRRCARFANHGCSEATALALRRFVRTSQVQNGGKNIRKIGGVIDDRFLFWRICGQLENQGNVQRGVVDEKAVRFLAMLTKPFAV